MKVLALLALAVLLIPTAAAAITYDGLSVPTDFAGLLKASQDNNTGFGDTVGVDSGSELDRMYVVRGYNSSLFDGIFIGITGNLETNGNSCVILLDTVPGGSNVLTATNGPGALTNLYGTTLDPGFTPEYAIVVNTYHSTTYVDLVDLVANTSRYLGSTPVNSGFSLLDGADNMNFAEGSFNNSNTVGVTDNTSKTPAQTEADAATASTGLELHIPFYDIGVDEYTASSVGVMALVDSGGGWISNQVLPALGGGYANLGQGGGGVNFANIPGDQFAVVDISELLGWYIVIDGLSIPAEMGSYLVATQNNYTQFGDRTGSAGSEMDQLFVGQDSGGFRIGITGNLETGGNFWMVFLEAGPGGYNVLQVPDGAGPMSGALQGMRGTIFDNGFAPTHALCANMYGSKIYVDLADLRAGTNRYIGCCDVGSGSGLLTEGDNPNGLIYAFNNGNHQGVTGLDADNPASATSGAEIYLPFADLGLATSNVKMMALLTGNSGYISNQSLPGMGWGTPNLGPGYGVPPANFNYDPYNAPTAHYITLPVTPSAFTPVASVQDARNMANGTTAQLNGAKVSAAFTSEGRFYVQTPGSPLGIAVYDAAPPAEGSVVSIKGFVTTAHGERALNAYQTSVISQPGAARVRPIGLGNQALGGAASANNPGVNAGKGASNVCSLVKIWGHVTYIDPMGEFFYVDDGSGTLDGTTHDDGTGTLVSNIGVRVKSYTRVQPDSMVKVTGVSSVFATYNDAKVPVYLPVVLTRYSSDVATP